MRSYAQGFAGDFAVKPTEDGFQWEIPAGPITIRYTAVFSNGTWKEVGDRIMPGTEPVRIFEMTLTRVEDTGWPAEGAVENFKGDEIMNQAEHDRRVDYIEFLTTDIEASKKFYSEIFGWEFTDFGPDYTSFVDGRIAGGFVLSTEVLTGNPLVVLYSIDLEGIRDRIVENGGKVVREIFEFPGGRRFHFIDPGGNELAVWSER
jgi:predicted enzyme related to lactoylglutathione lyase